VVTALPDERPDGPSRGPAGARPAAVPAGAAATGGAPSALKPAADPSLGDLVADASTAFSTILRGEIELAKLELRSSVKNAGVGIGLFAAAGVLLIFSLTFGLLALAEGLIALGLYRWLGYLIVFLLLLVVIGLFAFLGVRKVKRVKAPTRTIDTSKDTVAYLRSHPKAVPGSKTEPTT
jgi:uncharacterized membrane protein YqjE